MRRKLRVLALMVEGLVPPDSIEGLSDQEIAPWKMEFDVCVTLEDLEHEVLKLGVGSDLSVLRRALEEFRPHIVFNMVEEFHGVATYDQHLVAYLELVQQPYTGCNPRGLLLAHDKPLAKKILAWHGINVPDFAMFPIGRIVRRPARLQFPLLVKSATEEGSVGIAQKSIVRDDERLRERVDYVHQVIGTDAIAEEYVEGREIYVGVLGNERLRTFPIWELRFDNWAPGAARIASEKVKWDLRYQKERGIRTGPAEDLPPALGRRIIRACKAVYRALHLSGYARIDLRLAEDGGIHVLEANPNPQLAYGEDFAESAEKGGIGYEDLLQRILRLGLRYRPPWRI